MAATIPKIIPVINGSSAYKEAVEIATKALKNGSVIALPTDTIYGLAADASSDAAISKLYTIKRRDVTKPIAICLSHLDQINKYCNLNNNISQELLSQLLPGPVTLVFERSPSLNPNLNPETNNIGIRITKHAFIQDVVSKFNGPIALTSANISSHKSCLSVDEFKQIWPSIDHVFDAGLISLNEEQRIGSTVIDLSQSPYYNIIRKGINVKSCRKTLEDNSFIQRE